jgi:hypothetical protein
MDGNDATVASQFSGTVNEKIISTVMGNRMHGKWRIYVSHLLRTAIKPNAFMEGRMARHIYALVFPWWQGAAPLQVVTFGIFHEGRRCQIAVS